MKNLQSILGFSRVGGVILGLSDLEVFSSGALPLLLESEPLEEVRYSLSVREGLGLEMDARLSEAMLAWSALPRSGVCEVGVGNSDAIVGGATKAGADAEFSPLLAAFCLDRCSSGLIGLEDLFATFS